MGDPVVLLRDGGVKFHVFRGSPTEMGSAHGSLDPAFLRTRLDEWLTRPHDFDHPYFSGGWCSETTARGTGAGKPARVGRVEGEVWATLVDADGRDTGAPGLVSSLVGDGGYVYLAGDPVVHHREPGYEPLVMLPNQTRRLIGNVIRLLASSPPWIEVEDFPPVTAYQRLRDWDRRGINTFQFLPQVGPRYAIAILASYVGAEATVPIRFRIPAGKRLSRIFNGLTDESYMAEASVDSESVRYRLRITHADGVIPVVVEWV